MMDTIMKALRFPKRLLTGTVTKAPAFAVSNTFRDMMTVFVQGNHDKSIAAVKPFLGTMEGFGKSLIRTKDLHDMLAGGGGFGEGYAGTKPGAKSIARAMRKHLDKTATGKVLDTPAKLWGAYKDILAASESASRVMVYGNALKAGKTRKEALMEARDVLDFSRRGGHQIMRFLIETVPFMNANLQGLSRVGRALKENFVPVAMRGMLLATASAALLAINKDNEQYKALTDQQKTMYWHFFNVFKDGDHWKIPKPFEVGTIFATIPEIIGDYMFTNAQEPDRLSQAASTAATAFGQTMNLYPSVAAVTPLVEMEMNKNFYNGAPILTEADKGVLPYDQDGPGVNPTFRQFAHLMPDAAPDALQSPKMVQHLASGYIGTMKDYVLAATDALVRQYTGEPQPPTMDSGDIPGLRQFRDEGPTTSNRYVSKIYNVANEAAKLQKSLKKAKEAGTDEGDKRFDELTEKNDTLLSVADRFQRATEKISELRKKQREIQLDQDMTPDEKKEEIDQLKEQINEEAKDAYESRPANINDEIAANLIAVPKQQQVATLRKAGLPAMSGLLASLQQSPSLVKAMENAA
jgi:hypothetical protein